jgi:succinate-acetate transporter protein
MEKVKEPDVALSLGWILLAFAVFNSYMLLWSTRINTAVFLVFLTLEVTEILLFIGNFKGEAAGTGLVALGGWIGILTALVAWYASAATLVNSMAGRSILPVGGPLWTEAPGPAATPARAGARAA